MSIGIYKITSPSGKIYIGQSINIEYTWKCRYEKGNCKKQPKIYNSLLKYGWDNHNKEIIEECPESYLDELETWWKLYYGSVENGLNCNYWDRSPMRGKECSQETKDKMSNSRIGYIHPENSRIKISNFRKNYKFSEESKKKMSLSKKGIPKPKEFGELLRKSKPEGFGKNHSLKIKGRKQSIETCIKKSKAMKGKKLKFKRNSKPGVPIICLNDNKEFKSLKEASIYYNISVGIISNILLGHAKQTRKNKLIFNYANTNSYPN